MSMARFETGTLGGNLHAHGFSCGEKPPRMPRRIKAQQVEDGDETSELGSENDDSSDDGEKMSTVCHEEEKGVLSGTEALPPCSSHVSAGASALGAPSLERIRTRSVVQRELASQDQASIEEVARGVTASSGEDSEGSAGAISDDGSGAESAGSDQAQEKLLLRFVERQALGRDIPVDDLISSGLGNDESSEEAVAVVRSLVQAFVDRGILKQLPHDLFRRVPSVPEHEHLPRRGHRLGSVRQHGKAGVRLAQVQGGFAKEKPRERHGVGNKEELEEKFSKYF